MSDFYKGQALLKHNIRIKIVARVSSEKFAVNGVLYKILFKVSKIDFRLPP